MLLKSFRVTEFRSVEDSGWIDAENITALIGTNESGKTNILLPLWKLNPADSEKIDLFLDIPRDKFHKYRDAEEKPIFIRARYLLDETEQGDLSTILGCEINQISTVEIAKDYDNNVYIDYPLLTTEEKTEYIDNDDAREYLKGNMPKYVYYSNYGNLDSQIYLPNVINNLSRSDLGVKDAAQVRTLKTLFKFVKLNAKEIHELGKENSTNLSAQQIADLSRRKRERDALLSSAATEFTNSFKKWWRQGSYKFDFSADGNFFNIWVSDELRAEKIELESRSAGLQWFFSFYLVFLVETENYHKNAILLLDEPGVTLHPNAQKDLFEFFENLSEKNQIIYTTHSPFMIDSNHLERVRSVYIDTDGKSVVSDDLRASEKLKSKNQPLSIYPAHAALGLSVSDTLLVNCNPVLVEGESDQLYLSALKSLLISKKKISPLKEIVFVPTGGVKGIKVMSAILGAGNDNKPAVIVDGDKPGQNMAKELKKDLYAEHNDLIVVASDYSSIPEAEIEDLFPKQKLARIISRMLPRTEEIDEEFEDVVVADKPICNQVEEYLKTNNISLDYNWKVRLAKNVKHEILKGTDKILEEKDPEFEQILNLFKKI